MARPLSILDLARRQQDESSRETLRRVVRHARLADELGYHRVWYAEHHNTSAMASAAPEILIAHVAQQTSRIRVGSGGVMLPNQAPLKVAEVFRLLEALHPGRIDLGLGRAPGTDTRTAFALRRDPNALGASDYPQHVAELLAYVDGSFPDDHLLTGIRAAPTDIDLPPVWLLGSSEFSGQLAAQLGLGFAFAAHINRPAAEPVMRAYREQFTPSSRCTAPASILTVGVIVGATDGAAADFAQLLRVGLGNLMLGNFGPTPSLDDARAMTFPPELELRVRSQMTNHLIGTPASVAGELKTMADACQADEVMVTSWAATDEHQRFLLPHLMEAWNAADR